ncbi:hypothetical protein DPMN_182681 [Dreissena polymorpha]|uniref:Uncharacterized protein n=1 Tax=Dreissena polymorpha TaxID=45954 RepID=A0A9D4DG63_DREPO|nr:hypothetical protein DPMN_182681 [Dreissena polymorpha]
MSPVRSGHRSCHRSGHHSGPVTGHVTGPVRSLITIPVRSPVMSPVRSCHQSGLVTGLVTGPVRSLITGPVRSPVMSPVRSCQVRSPVRSLITGLVTGQQSSVRPATDNTSHRSRRRTRSSSLNYSPIRRRIHRLHQGLDIGHTLPRRAVLIVAALVSDHVVTHGDVILEDLGLIAADPHLGRSRSRHRRKRGRRQPSRRHQRTSLSTTG